MYRQLFIRSRYSGGATNVNNADHIVQVSHRIAAEVDPLLLMNY
eukprot:COSAG03_NODE_2246_length_2960_cov_2.024816_3_plen_44_part_00